MGRLNKPSIKQLMSAVDQYERNLLNKNFLLVGTRGSEIGYTELRFLGRNFKHLTGVRTTSPHLKGNYFWKVCSQHKLSERDLGYDTNGTAQQKLNAAKIAFDPGRSFRKFGPSNHARENVEVEVFAGSQAASIGFKNTEAYYLDPVTLLDTSIGHEVAHEKLFKVIGVYSKRIPERVYQSASFKDEQANWGLIRQALPEELRYIVDLDVQK